MTSVHNEKTNRLIHEKSPYLLQHARNPVDWYAWGGEAFEKARKEDKPILLSIGYSTCHWCHVMAHESFEDPAIAELMNRHFVCIKVDREEHPDVDQVYMQAVMRMRGQGGWPLTVFLTPALEPFFGGTYFPPQQRWDMPGMQEILPSVAEAWRMRKAELVSSAQQLTASLNKRMEGISAATVNAGLLDAGFNQAVVEFDATHGGFGAAPKFPRPHELSFLLRYAIRRQSAQAREIVEATLENMSRGGIRDHLGGGFHRYSTDEQWLVPHFEKMLYDQALLSLVYLEAFRLTGKRLYADIAGETIDYVLRDLRNPQGGFYSAEDADSEGEEGKFYVWTPEEITAVLGAEEAVFFNRVYGVSEAGNFEHGTSILHLPRALEDFVSQRLKTSRDKLLARRNQRPRPHRDDKILTSWNGLMIAALAHASTTLGQPRYEQAAAASARFVLQHLFREGVLLRRFRDSEARFPGTLEDYAYFAYGLLALYQATLDPEWLKQAKIFSDGMIRRFWDDEEAGFFLRGKDEEPLIARLKEAYDGATPSGNSMAVTVLAYLGRLTADSSYTAMAQKALDSFGPDVSGTPFGFPQLLSAFDFLLGPGQEIVIAGDGADGVVRQMASAVQGRFLPNAVMVWHPSSGLQRQAIESLAPYTVKQEALDGQSTAYVCSHYTCSLPVTTLEQLKEQLDHAAQPDNPA